MNVSIVGAGISGLSVAISLRRTGHTVTLYDRSTLLNEVGAAINVPPNVGRVLLPWGLDPEKSRFVASRGMDFCNHKTLEPIFRVDHSTKAADVWGVELYFAHRVDLHEALKRLATEEDGPGVPAKIVPGTEVVEFDPETPSITLSNGTRVTSHLVVAADGINSRAVEVVLGEARPLLPANTVNCCFRFLVPWNILAEDENTNPFLNGHEGRAKVHSDVESKIRLVSYPCRGHEVMNFVCLLYDDKMSLDKEDWHASVPKDELLRKFQGNVALDAHHRHYPNRSKATDVKRWPLLYRKPIQTWSKHLMTLAGDAAHPLLPHKAQGGAQGIEDGIALGLALSGLTSAAPKWQVQSRLAVYEDIRVKRASLQAVLSNTGYDEPIPDEIHDYLEGKPVPDTVEAQMKISYGYDVMRHIVQKMKEKVDPEFKVPSGFFPARK
ncbi:hypothetical protein MKZ38_008659 [Zalerion maritima]|uniref:FAD-binding domain-containing protein n=1 Tax=Zalerion maritima TaxID=339359 RepID=A0AAD5RHT5_9PEZI|nr:hypothetical protein MKZ38_008659 [Zalerion maritima]